MKPFQGLVHYRMQSYAEILVREALTSDPQSALWEI